MSHLDFYYAYYEPKYAFKLIFNISSALSFHSQFNPMIYAHKKKTKKKTLLPGLDSWSCQQCSCRGVDGKRRMNSCPQICTDPFNHHFGNFSARIQDEGVAEPVFTQPEVSMWEVLLDVMIILNRAPVVSSSIIKYKLKIGTQFIAGVQI